MLSLDFDEDLSSHGRLSRRSSNAKVASAEEQLRLEERLEVLQALQQMAAEQLGDAREASSRNRTSRQRLRIEAEDVEILSRTCREELRVAETEAAAEMAEAEICDGRLKFLRMSCLALASANADPPQVGDTLGQMHREAAGSALEDEALISRQISDYFSKTLALDRDTELLRREQLEASAEIDRLRAEHQTRTASLVADEQELIACRDEVLQLRTRHCQLQAAVEAIVESRNQLAIKRQACDSTLMARRHERDSLKTLAWAELHDAKERWSRTNLVKQRAALDQHMAQQELIGMASSHSRQIQSSNGTFTLREGVGTIFDHTSADMRVSLLKASNNLKSQPVAGLGDTTSSLRSSLRTPRSGIKDTAHLVLGIARGS